MDGQPYSDNPSGNATNDPLPPSPIETAREQAEVSKHATRKTGDEEEPTTESGGEMKTLQILSLVFDAVLVLVGIGALLIYRGQLSVMRGTLAEMQRSGSQSTDQAWRAIDNVNWMARSVDQSGKGTVAQMKSQSQAMQRSANTARDTLMQARSDSIAQDTRNRETREASEMQSREALNASIQASRIDQRAWINMIDVHAPKEPATGEDFAIRFSLSNTGKTPAMDVTIKHAIGFDVVEPGKRDWSTVPIVNRGIMFPGTIMRELTATFREVTPVLMTGYIAHISKLYFVTRLDYRDVFQKPHWEEICLEHSLGETLDRFSGCSVMGDIDKNDESPDKQ